MPSAAGKVRFDLRLSRERFKERHSILKYFVIDSDVDVNVQVVDLVWLTHFGNSTLVNLNASNC